MTVWHCSCPGCGGRVRAEPGHTQPWVYICEGRCGGAWELLRAGYLLSGSQLHDGPEASPECRWHDAGRRLPRAPDPMPTPVQFAVWRRERRRRTDLLAWLADRGLPEVSEWFWGYGQPDPNRPPGVVIPIPPRRPVTYRIRFWPDPWIPSGGDKPVKIAGPRGHPVRLWPDLPSGGEIILCEGELDAALALYHDLRAVSTPGMMIKTELATALGRSVDRVPVIFDVGDNADVAADRAVGLIKAAGAEAWPVRLPLKHENDDIGDWFVTYRRTAQELRELIRTARPLSASAETGHGRGLSR
jgi:hypothetical protein